MKIRKNSSTDKISDKYTLKTDYNSYINSRYLSGKKESSKIMSKVNLNVSEGKINKGNYSKILSRNYSKGSVKQNDSYSNFKKCEKDNDKLTGLFDDEYKILKNYKNYTDKKNTEDNQILNEKNQADNSRNKNIQLRNNLTSKFSNTNTNNIFNTTSTNKENKDNKIQINSFNKLNKNFSKTNINVNNKFLSKLNNYLKKHNII